MTPQFNPRAGEITTRRIYHNAHPAVMRIVEAVAHATGFTVQEILSRSRIGPLAEARQLAMFEAREAGFSLNQIARAMDRDHSTVISGIRVEMARRQAE